MKNKNIYKNQATLVSIPHNSRQRVFCVKKIRTKNFQKQKFSETKKIQTKKIKQAAFRIIISSKKEKKKKMSIQIYNVTREMHHKFFEDLREHHGIDITF
ncbi:MAG: hypothetical protein QMC37_03030, partial [Flavobacteriales bacterium]